MSLRAATARRIRGVLLAAAAVSLLAAPASANFADTDPDPLPVGACVRATVIDARPICIVVEDPLR